ncbi:substrate-binding domain-containing protein [Halomonas sp. SSL-5]|uniref:PstS family phosphate ABC transporter substrate-binding protein n=1 Tax=Halomonas sp. SSL-5 TaxID=3065855 RepID=UPI002739AAD4|nr:substrate-binding domain-containing protein [Halomonas sp. SSL-5]MDY7116167.1 substrate-binding domain-containing protein [Halomonas sp. SSL-5]
MALLLGGLLTLLSARLPADDVVGPLGAVGSDTLAGLMLRWGELLTERHPGVRLQFQASGSASAPAALAAGTTRLGAMSRPMNEVERGTFIERHGYPPVELEVARDALAVIVHRHNPLKSLSRRELDAIFSESRRCGAERPIERWSQLGVTLPGDRIVLHGRNVASGTHDLFRMRALCGGSYRVRLNEHPGSAAVVAAVAAEPSAIGFAGLNHLTTGVKALPRRDATGEAASPTPQAVRRGDYSLSRALYLYLNLPPGGALPGPERAFLELVFSPLGQSVVEELGFVDLTEASLARQREWLASQPPAE